MYDVVMAAGLFLTSLLYTSVYALLVLFALSVILPSIVVVSGWAWVGSTWLMMCFAGGSNNA